jgi:hypothetical protein
MRITLETENVWTFQIAGENFFLDASRIPEETRIAIVKDRLANKGRDTWADSSKVTPECTRQDLWAAAMHTVYSGSWMPGASGRGPRKKSMDFGTFLMVESLKEAKRRIGKLGFTSKLDGYHFKPDDKNDLQELANRLSVNEKWEAVKREDFAKLHSIDELDI